MAGSGKREQVHRKMDLTSGDRFDGRRPGNRGHAADIEADARFAFLGKILKVGIKVRDKAGAMAEPFMYLTCTLTAMIPPVVTAGICLTAGVAGAVVLAASLPVLLLSCVAAGAVFIGARTARREKESQERDDKEQRPQQQRTVQAPLVKNKRKVVQGTRGRKGGAKAQRRRRRP